MLSLRGYPDFPTLLTEWSIYKSKLRCHLSYIVNPQIYVVLLLKFPLFSWICMLTSVLIPQFWSILIWYCDLISSLSNLLSCFFFLKFFMVTIAYLFFHINLELDNLLTIKNNNNSCSYFYWYHPKCVNYLRKNEICYILNACQMPFYLFKCTLNTS